jgi:hypothetical protein
VLEGDKGGDCGGDIAPTERVPTITSLPETVLVASEVETSRVLIESNELGDSDADMTSTEIKLLRVCPGRGSKLGKFLNSIR